jgi:hypothetical protein
MELTNDLLSNFPINIKPFYEKITHNKVYNYNIIVAIPKGLKCIAWFTTYDCKNVCVIIQYNNNKIQKSAIFNCCFDNILCSGTILYGTKIIYNNNNYFSIEDIYKYKGEYVNNKKYCKRLNIILELFKNYINQMSYNNTFIVFGIPLMDTKWTNIIQKIQKIKYPIEYLQYRFYETNNIYNLKYYGKNKNNIIIQKSINNNNIFSTFKVIALPEADSYELYTINKNTNNCEYYENMLISSYTKSVMMNKLFRVIKENINLDFLEESDDEDNEDNEDFIIKDKYIIMKCKYSINFNKWEPLCANDIQTNNEISYTQNIYKYKKN